MRRSVPGLLGLVVLVGLTGASKAEDPSSFLDLRFSVSPYSRLTREELQPLRLSLSFGFLQLGFAVVEVEDGAYEVDYEDESGQSFRVLGGVRLRGPDLQDVSGNGLLLESTMALGYQRYLGGNNGLIFRLSFSALYWFWRGRLALGIELGNDIGFPWGAHAAMVAAVAFPWSGGGAIGAKPAVQLDFGGSKDEMVDIRLRLSPMYCKLNMPNSLGVLGLGVALTLWGHLVLEYDADWTGHAHSDPTVSQGVMLGGRIRALDLRDDAGCGLVVDTAVLAGYSHYVDEVSEVDCVTLESLSLRQDWDLIYWFTRNLGAGLWLSLGYIIPVHARYASRVYPDDVDSAMEPHGGLGAALVFSAAY